MELVPSAAEWCELAMSRASGKAMRNKDMWDAMAPNYAHKRRRSGYLSQLLERLDLLPGETVFDMGCGPGVLAVPLAQAGHDVYAVDFSDGMLAELERAVAAANVRDKVHAFKRAWQDNWDDLPQADVAISSRSMTTSDYADAVAKLESKARRRVIVTTNAGEAPWLDLHLRQALGREDSAVSYAEDFVIFLNYLLQSGRFPSVSYITHVRRPTSSDPNELKEFLRRSANVTAEEEAAFDRFVEEHMTSTEDGDVQMDYDQQVRWAIVSWDTGARL